MQDLSSLLPGDPVTALAPTSQSGGNMMSDSKLAVTAPGSQPVDPLPPAKEQADPKVTPSNSTQIKPGTAGRKKPRNGYSPGLPAWKTTS
jgi:hypothetical protein